MTFCLRNFQLKNSSKLLGRLCFYLLILLIAGISVEASDKITVETLIKKEIANLQTIGDKIEKLWPQKDCASLITRYNTFPLVSVACRVGYSAEDRDIFLDFLFKNGYILQNEDYSLQEENGLYLYKTTHQLETENFIFFKLYFREANYLWPKTPRKIGQMAIFVNDIYEQKTLIQWQSLGIPISYGVLPFKKETQLVSKSIESYGQEKWLALSLEPLKYHPTNGRVLLVKDTLEPERVAVFLQEAMSEVEPVKGVATRLGSLFSSNVYAMRAVLEPLKEKNIKYFLDNTGSANSVAFTTAQIMSFSSYQGLAIMEGQKAQNSMEQIWQKAIEKIRANGSIVLVVSAANSKNFEFIKRALKSKNGRLIDYYFVSQLPAELR